MAATSPSGHDKPAVPRPPYHLLALALAGFLIPFFLLPISTETSSLDPAKIRIGLGILFCAGILWLTEAVPLAITALLVAVLAVLTGTLSVSESLKNFAHPLIFLFLGGFGIAAALSNQGIDRFLAQKLVQLARGNFRLTALALSLAAAGLSMWISNTATTALLLPVALGILREIRSRSDAATATRAAPLLLLGVAYSASIGGMATLIGTAPNLIAAEYLDIDFSGWMRIGLPVVAILLPVALILLHFILRPGDLPQLEISKEKFAWTPPRIATLIIFLLTVAAWLNSRNLAAMLAIEKGFDSIIAIASVVILSSFKLVRWRDISSTTDWGVLLLFGGGLTLSEILKPNRTGASSYLAEQLSSLTTGWPSALIIVAIVLFVIFLTELTSNTATTALLVPIFGTLAAEMGFASAQLVLPLAFAASCAFMLPIATPPNAIVYASGKIPQRTMMRVGLILNVVLALILSGLSQVLF